MLRDRFGFNIVQGRLPVAPGRTGPYNRNKVFGPPAGRSRRLADNKAGRRHRWVSWQRPLLDANTSTTRGLHVIASGLRLRAWRTGFGSVGRRRLGAVRPTTMTNVERALMISLGLVRV